MKLIDQERMHELMRRGLLAEARYLAEQLGSEDVGMRRYAVEALAELGPEARLPEVVEGLRRCLRRDPDAEVREGAALALGQLGADAAAQDLIACLDDPGASKSLRMTAIEALRELGSQQALPRLEHLRQDADPHIRWLAAEAIREINAVKAGLPPRWQQEIIEGEPEEAGEHPPLVRFPEAARTGWRDDERRHVSACERCQRLVAADWRIQHPSLWTLVSYLADPAGFPDRRAMELHLERDGCRQCRLLKNSGLVDALAQLMRAGKSLERWLSLLALDLEMPQMSALAAQPIKTRGGAPFLGPEPPGEVSPPTTPLAEQEGPGGQLLSLLLNEQGKLEARLEIRDPNWQPLLGLLELAGERNQQQHGLEFKKLPSGHFGVTLLLEPVAVSQQLGTQLVALAARPAAGFLEELARLREDPNAEVRQAAVKLADLLGARH